MKEGALWSRSGAVVIETLCNYSRVPLHVFARFNQDGKGPDDISSSFLLKSMSGLVTFELASGLRVKWRTMGGEESKLGL
jgi:hypothetical protein